MPRFVVQNHPTPTHHFDLRLEREGVLKTWAAPKGVPDKPGTKRLAIHVEDHDRSFGSFERQTPECKSGAGEIWIWHQETYVQEELSAEKIAFAFDDHRAFGKLKLVPSVHGKANEWLVIKVDRTPESVEQELTFHA